MTKIPVKYEEQNIGSNPVRIPVRIIRNDSDRKRELFLQRYAVWNYWKKYILGIGIFSFALVFSSSTALATGNLVWHFDSAGTGYSFGNGSPTYTTYEANQMILSGSGAICSIVTSIQNTRTSTQQVNLKLYSGGTNPVNGTLMESSTVTVSSSYNGLVTFNFNYCYAFTPSSTWWATISNPLNNSDTNTLLWNGGNSGNYGWDYVGVEGWDGTPDNRSFYLQVYDYDPNSTSSYFGGPGYATGNENIDIRYPASSTSSIYPFDYFVYDIQGLNAEMKYNILFHTTMTASDKPDDPYLNNSWDDRESQIGITQTYGGKAIRFSGNTFAGINLFDDGYERSFTTTAKICRDLACSVVYDSSTINFKLDSDSNIYDNPYVQKAFPPENPISNSKTNEKLRSAIYPQIITKDWCGTDAGGFSTLGWAFCKLSEYMFKPSTSSVQFVLDNANTITNLYPIKYVFESINVAKASMENNYSAKNNLSLSLPLGSTTFNYTLLSSSTLTNIMPSSTKNQIFTVESYIFYLTTLGLIITAIL